MPRIQTFIKMGMSQKRVSRLPKIQQLMTRHWTVKFRTNQDKRTRVKIKMTSKQMMQLMRKIKIQLSSRKTR